MDDTILDELLALEALHLDPREGTQDLSALLSDGFSEIGASGRRIDRAEALHILHDRRGDGRSAGRVGAAAVTALAEGVLLLTYDLELGSSVTRRSSIWRLVGPGRWELVFHQGTPVRPT